MKLAFFTPFMRSGTFFTLERAGDCLACGANAQQQVAGSYRTLLVIEHDVALENSRLHNPEFPIAQSLPRCRNATHRDLDFDFLRRLHAIRISESPRRSIALSRRPAVRTRPPRDTRRARSSGIS